MVRFCFAVAPIAVLALSAVAVAAEKPAPAVLAHDVYFTLKDASPASTQALVAACRKYLSGHEGAVFFAVGTRAGGMKRDVNDQAYDVSLHVYFRDEAAHDVYQGHARHKQFITENEANWKKVRVFDSWVETVR
jgi:hypothetical protein